MKEKYFKVSRVKEYKDISTLIKLLQPIVTEDTIIVNCSPDYSSIISQRVIHSYFDNPLEMVNFDMPFPNSDWAVSYEEYCRRFSLGLEKETTYIFIDSGVLRGKNFYILDSYLKLNTDSSIKYYFASLYVQDDAIFTPNIYVEKFNKKEQGMLLFWWENIKCTLFD